MTHFVFAQKLKLNSNANIDFKLYFWVESKGLRGGGEGEVEERGSTSSLLGEEEIYPL